MASPYPFNPAPSSGSGGSSDWGEASTAKFAGSGSPVGVVTPTGEGDLYVDETGPGLWQANGLADTDWVLVGGGLPTGWTQDASDPANVDGGSGSLVFDPVDSPSCLITNYEVLLQDPATSEQYLIETGQGIKSTPSGSAAFTAVDANMGATAAMDAGTMPIVNLADGINPTDGATLEQVFVTVVGSPPSTFVAPLVFDSTAVTGGLYIWDGSAYQKVSLRP